jgi:hypothetical protein
MAGMPLDPDANEWDLPIRGFLVTDVRFSGELYVIAYGEGADSALPKGPPRTQIRLGGPFGLSLSGGIEHRLNAEDPWDTLVPVLALRAARVAFATAS